MRTGSRLAAAALILLVAAGCAKPATTRGTSAARTPTPVPSEAPAAVEKNPPGDIPDSQQFVRYAAPAGGYHLEVPEGWARTESGSSVSYADKLNSIRVDIEPADAARTPDTVRSIDEPKLRSSVRAFEEIKVEALTLPAGPAVLLRYRANSEPDAVTGNPVRLEADRYEMFNAGHLAILTMAAPVGADNVDVWKRVSRSFGWGG